MVSDCQYAPVLSLGVVQEEVVCLKREVVLGCFTPTWRHYFGHSDEVFTRDNAADEELGRLADLVAAHLESFTPDVLIAPTPYEFLRERWENALFVYFENGLFSRPPMQWGNFLDPLSFMRHGYLTKFRDSISRTSIPEYDAQIINRIRDFYQPKLTQICDEHLGFLFKENRFDGYLLVVGQPYNSGFSSNVDQPTVFDFLSHLLERVPKNLGVIFIRHSIDYSLDHYLAILKKRHQNLIVDSRVDAFKNVSQFLLQRVDGVVTASSTGGVHGALWRKKLFVIGDSHIKLFAHANNVDDVEGVLNAPYDEKVENSIYWALIHYYVPVFTYIKNHPTWFGEFVGHGLQHFRVHGIDENFYRPIDDPSKVLSSYLVPDTSAPLPEMRTTQSDPQAGRKRKRYSR